MPPVCEHGKADRYENGTCRKCRLETARKWREANKDKRRARSLARKYGITVEQYEALLALQGGVCAICGRPPKKRRLSCDHDHALEKNGVMQVRGLLCDLCNRLILGILERSKVDARKVVEYLYGPEQRARIAAAGILARRDALTVATS